MFKYILMSFAIFFFACESQEEKDKNLVKETYGPLIEKAKATEEVLQKQADSIAQKLDSIGMPR